MNKLKLAVEELTVATFETVENDAGRGTVEANVASGITCVCETWLRCPTILTRDCCTP